MPKNLELVQKIMTNVYLDRYKALEFPEKPKQGSQRPFSEKISEPGDSELPEGIWKEKGEGSEALSEKLIEEIGSELRDGTLVVPWETFQNKCLEALLGALGQQLNLLTFANDDELSNYLYKTFSNLIQSQIYELSPGLETRVKQVKKILSEYCDPFEYNKQKCWKLKKGKYQETSPADLEKLEATAQKLKAPALQIPKKQNAKRGPSIPQKAMETYILKLLKEIGGSVIENDLITFIRKLYGLEPIQLFGFSFSTSDLDEISVDEWLSSQSCEEENLLLNPDYQLMARDLYERLTPRMRDVFKFIYIDGIKVDQTAKLMKCSDATVSNITKDIQQIFLTYFFSDDNHKVTQEEGRAVYALVGDLILRDEK